MFTDARTNAMRTAAFVAALFIGLGTLSSLMLPNPKGEAGTGEVKHGGH